MAVCKVSGSRGAGRFDEPLAVPADERFVSLKAQEPALSFCAIFHKGTQTALTSRQVCLVVGPGTEDRDRRMQGHDAVEDLALAGVALFLHVKAWLSPQCEVAN